MNNDDCNNLDLRIESTIQLKGQGTSSFVTLKYPNPEMTGTITRFFQSGGTGKGKRSSGEISVEESPTNACVQEEVTHEPASQNNATTYISSLVEHLGSCHAPLEIVDDSDNDSLLERNEATQTKPPPQEGIAESSPMALPQDTQTDGNPSPILEQSANSMQKENPFAQFAYNTSTAAIPVPRLPKPSWHRSNLVPSFSAYTSVKKVEKRKKPKKDCQFVPLKEIPVEEQQRITKKWQGLADQSAPLEVRRFQVLLAARLHARCQEPSVRKAMAALREAFPELTVQTMAKADPEVLAHYITNLQYYNTKANQVVKAAQEINMRFHGMVPEDEHSLLQITGIGKVFADLLAFVNTRAAHDTAPTESLSTEDSTMG